ncbi:MAG: hypothetical protein ABW221_10465 [Vicinamibacteria bacterium]
MTSVIEPLPFRLLIDEAMRLTRRHFRQMYLPVALPVALAQALVPVAQALIFGGGFFTAAPDPASMIAGMAGFFGLVFVTGAVWGLGYGALLVAATEAQTDAGVSMARAWLTMVRPRVLGTSVLVALALLVGCALCLLPGVFVALAFSLVVPVMAAERIYGTTALARAVALVRQNPGGQFVTHPMLKVFLILVIGYVLSSVVGLVIQMPFVIAQQVIVFRSAAEGQTTDPMQLMTTMTLLQLPASVLNALATTVVQLYLSFALALFYFDLRRRQEGGDLESAIQEMAGRPPDAPPAAG